MNILLGVAFALAYWALSVGRLRSAPCWVKAIPKWSAAIATHSHPLIPVRFLTAQSAMGELLPLQHLFKWLTVTAYSLGDVALLYDEPKALPFFAAGHISFVVAVSAFDFIPGVMATMCEWIPIEFCVAETANPQPQAVMYYIGVAHLAATATALTVLVLWIIRNGFEKLSTLALYAFYMYTLALAMYVGICYHAYGIIFFVLSDVIIGFKIDALHAITYPLYYTSLVYIYYWV